jgi:Peptidase family M48
VRVEFPNSLYASTTVLLLFLYIPNATSQNVADPDIPTNFRLDMQTAARLRPQLEAESEPASEKYIVGRTVLGRLASQIATPANFKLGWDLRIVQDDQLNAYASPDGTVYVESGLAELAGSSAGLWAAILSHEIAHVVRRDWARRYLFEKKLEGRGAFIVVLGDPSVASTSWSTADKASQEMGQYCRQLELQADQEGLMLMARAGYHPDFVPSLHHILHAQESRRRPRSLAAMHPCWEERDRELSRTYVAASIEFNRRWPEWYASPGGNPPVLVFTEEPVIRKTSSAAWEILVPLRCQNLAGAVEVVLKDDARYGKPFEHLSEKANSAEVRELTGCTSPTTTVALHLDHILGNNSATRATEVYVVDAWGSILAKADLPKLPH